MGANTSTPRPFHPLPFSPQLRSAWGIARSLGRVLIMPAFICGMDRVWFPHGGALPLRCSAPLPYACLPCAMNVLCLSLRPAAGVFPGSDPLFTIPFTPCPMDHILDPETMDKCAHLSVVPPFFGRARTWCSAHPRLRQARNVGQGA